MARRSPDALLAAALWLLGSGLAHGAAPALSLLPQSRPAALKTAPPKRLFTESGSVCGVAAIKGVKMKAISDSSGCGIAEPVRVTSMSGVRLNPPTVIDCAAAKAVNEWVDGAAVPALRGAGGGLAALQVAGGYSCRTRNNQPDAKLSEHAQGKAVDIAGFKLRDGHSVSVQNGWSSGRHGPALKQMHESACSTFGTVLGPNSDRFHRDHFHLDTVQHYSGAYCR